MTEISKAAPIFVKNSVIMKKLITLSTVLSVVFMFTSFTSDTTENNIIIDKTEKSKDGKTIVAIAAGNQNFSTLIAAVKAAGLVKTLNSQGPFTVFAPVNDAFGKLPKGTIPSLLKTENKRTLTAVLTYHVVKGKFIAADVVKAIKANNGKFTITTVQGGKLVASMSGANVILTDTKGNTSKIILADVDASNGVIHAIDTVVMP